MTARSAMLRISFTTRAITRAQWKWLYRQLRIVNRESLAAATDAAIFGTGFLKVGPGVPDFIRRVHPAHIDGVSLMEAMR